MKYHKITGIEKTICTAEQKIAYNIAFRAHISFQEKYDAAAKISAICKDDAVHDILKFYFSEYLRTDGKNTKYDTDAIYSCLLAGLDGYLKKPFIATDYEQIGTAFPAYYLNA